MSQQLVKSDNPMTVRELVAALLEMPQDKRIELETAGEGGYCEVDTVFVENDVVMLSSKSALLEVGEFDEEDGE